MEDRWTFDQPLFDGTGRFDEDGLARYLDELLERFERSPEFGELAAGEGLYIDCVLRYGVAYQEVPPASLSARDLRVILLELFPRKVVCPPRAASAIVAQLRAYLSFVKREWRPARADECLAMLTPGFARELEPAWPTLPVLDSPSHSCARPGRRGSKPRLKKGWNAPWRLSTRALSARRRARASTGCPPSSRSSAALWPPNAAPRQSAR